MTDSPEKARGLTRWPWRALYWTLAVCVVLDCASLAVEYWKPQPQESGPTLANWGGAGLLTPAELFGMELKVLLVINLALLATFLGIRHVFGRLRRRAAGVGTALFVAALLPLALIGVGGTLGLSAWIYRRLTGP